MNLCTRVPNVSLYLSIECIINGCHHMAVTTWNIKNTVRVVEYASVCSNSQPVPASSFLLLLLTAAQNTWPEPVRMRTCRFWLICTHPGFAQKVSGSIFIFNPIFYVDIPFIGGVRLRYTKGRSIGNGPSDTQSNPDDDETFLVGALNKKTFGPEINLALNH